MTKAVVQISALTNKIQLLAALLAASLTLSLAVFFWEAHSKDKLAAQASHQMLETVLEIEFSTLGNILADYTNWDDSYQNTVVDDDKDWIEDNFGDADHLRKTFSVTASLVIDADNKPLFLMKDSNIIKGIQSLELTSLIEGGVLGLLNEGRQNFARDGQGSHSFVSMDGQPFFMTVQVIHPHTPEMNKRVTITPQSAFVAAFLVPLDQDFLLTSQQRFALKELHLSNDLNSDDALSRPLIAPNGQTVGALHWQIDLPSRQEFEVLLPALLITLLCFGGLSWYVMQKLQHSQNELWLTMHQAEVANRAKSSFLSSMSHELRTPLNSIIGFAQVLAHEPSVQKDLKPIVDEIIIGSNTFLRLVDKTLLLAQIDDDTLTLNTTPTDPRILIEWSVPDLEQRLKNTTITYRVEKSPTALPNIIVDQKYAMIVLQSLISNAVFYNRSDGQVILTSSHPTPGRVRLSVQDTGNGIDENDYERVFEPFDRMAMENSPISGLGIGLTIAQKLTTAMNGTIGFDSTPGQGSTFWVEFEATDEAV